MAEITPADILAAGDVVDQLTEASDQLSLERAAPLRDALNVVKKKVADCISMVETRMLATVEKGAQTIGSTTFSRKVETKWRPDQEMIRRQVVKQAAWDHNGEALPAVDAAANAVNLMYQLFVSPSQMPKAEGLTSLRLFKSDVAVEVVTGAHIETKEAP